MVIGSRLEAELGKDAPGARLDGLFADVQFGGDRVVRAVLGHHREHVALAVGERGERAIGMSPFEEVFDDNGVDG